MRRCVRANYTQIQNAAATFDARMQRYLLLGPQESGLSAPRPVGVVRVCTFL